MKRNLHSSKAKMKFSRRETLPLLRGMFIFPKSIKYIGKTTGTKILHETSSQTDSLNLTGWEKTRDQKEPDWVLTDEGFLMCS